MYFILKISLYVSVCALAAFVYADDQQLLKQLNDGNAVFTSKMFNVSLQILHL